MDFYAVLDQVLALLRQRGRVSYRALKRQFDLDDAYLDDLKVEIIEVHQCAVDQEGTMLVWTGEAASAATPEPVQAPAPLAYTPPYLAEKILDVPQCPGRRAQAGHGALCGPEGLYGTHWPTAIRRRPGSSSTRCWSA